MEPTKLAGQLPAAAGRSRHHPFTSRHAPKPLSAPFPMPMQAAWLLSGTPQAHFGSGRMSVIA